MLAPSGGGLILYQAYGNLYDMTVRKAYLLEDKQIPCVWVFDEVFLALGWLLEEIHVTLAHLEKKQIRLQTYIKSLEDYANSGWRRRLARLGFRKPALSVSAVDMYRKPRSVEMDTISIFSLCYLYRNSFSSTTTGDANPIHTLGDYSKPSHEGYRNTIELSEGNNVVPLRSDTIRLVQNGCSFHGLRSGNPNQHLKGFLKLVDSLDLDDANMERTRLRLFQFSLRDQASNWLERLPAGSISTWEDLTTRFLAQFFPPGRTAKLRNDILMFQQHQGESLSEA
ncbi:zinc finger, CCHC-type containing protein [Tanacetum coccineum]